MSRRASLVFLVDTSGSMQGEDRLGLAKKALRVLTENLIDGDTVALVTYAGTTRVVLEPTGMKHKARILAALEDLTSGGGTSMGSGMDLAYKLAARDLAPGRISRVIVLSDGDENIGPMSHEDILASIQGRVKEGVTLSTIGFGTGNYHDTMMEQLANKGNGSNFYIDSLDAAKRVFTEQLSATLEVVAKDAKFQVDFDPKMIARYRLVGYENRDIADNDFRDDRVDAGEIGAGHPLGTVRIRHKEPNGERATEAVFPIEGGPAGSFASASRDFRFAFAAAAFADVLRGGQDAEHWSLADIRAIAHAAVGEDADRREMVSLIDRAIALRGRTATR